MPAGHAGLLLPPDVIQPVFVRFQRDSRHVMAVLDGHPDYEAVEAMIQDRPAGGHAIRAIITRHDQSQIDHVNDPALLDEMRGADRTLYQRPIALQLETASGGRRRARLAFRSMADEEVVLGVTTVGPADARGAGLTDPGGHSATVSLPLMWRGASALAGPETEIWVAGIRYLARARAGSGPPGARQGYYSEPHLMGVVRAGIVRLKRLGRPARLAPGEAWIFADGGREVVWRIVARASDGLLRIEKDGGEAETVHARPCGDTLALIDVMRHSGDGGPLTLHFTDDGRFAVAIPEAGQLMVGQASTTALGEGAVIRLAPEEPAWAASRAVGVECTWDGDDFTFTTTIG
jgi:hypothetical protein